VDYGLNYSVVSLTKFCMDRHQRCQIGCEVIACEFHKQLWSNERYLVIFLV